MNAPSTSQDKPITSVAEAIARLEALDEALPADDGLRCFNHMYLWVMQQIAQRLSQGFFSDPVTMTHLDVVFASLYFAATDAGEPSAAPAAWRPLLDRRAEAGIEPVQFALAGMNTHISHDLPIAIATTCADLSFAPTATVFRDDYEKVDQILDAAEQSARESFESGAILAADQHLRSVVNLIANWNLNQAGAIRIRSRPTCRGASSPERLVMPREGQAREEVDPSYELRGVLPHRVCVVSTQRATTHFRRQTTCRVSPGNFRARPGPGG